MKMLQRLPGVRILQMIHSAQIALNFRMASLLAKKWHRQNQSANYQPLPWIGLDQSRRTEGTIARWDAISPHISKPGSLVDIGGNVGFFAYKAAEKGCLAWCIESDLPSNMIGEYAKWKCDFKNVHFIRWHVDKDNCQLMPCFDYVILFSVFHHWCAAWGYGQAKEMLRDICSKANGKLFFEMGHAEMSAKYNIPAMEPGETVEEHIANMLYDVSGVKPEPLGKFEVFVDKGKKRSERYLFVLGFQ